MAKKFVSFKEAAEILSTHEMTLRKWVYAGKLPAVRFGKRCIRIAIADLERITEERRICPAA